MKMDIEIRLFSYADAGGRPGTSVGVSRVRPGRPRGSDQATSDASWDWEPDLAPSVALDEAWGRGELNWLEFTARYRLEMQTVSAQRQVRRLAALAREQRVNLGCHCARSAGCHRSLLRELLWEHLEAGEEEDAGEEAGRERYFSPACSMPEIED